VYKPTLLVRPPGIPTFSRIELRPLADVPDIFVATIPGSLVTDSFDYYLETFDKDGNGPSNSGTEAEPWHVQVAPVAEEPKPEVPTTTTPPPDVPPATTPTPQVMAPPPPVPVAPKPPPETPTPIAAYATLGAGTAVIVAGAIVLGVGGSNFAGWQTDEQDLAAHNAAANSLIGFNLQPLHQQANTELTAGGLLLGAGIVTVGVGLYLWLAPSRAESAETAAAREESTRHPKLASLLLDF
jgi:hypothetical protein